MLVLGTDYEEYSAAVSGDWVPRIGATVDWNHGVVHFLQALGSQLLHNHGLRLMRAGREVLAAIDDGAAAERFAREARFLTVPGERGLSAWDLMEAAAAIEARRLIPQATWTSTQGLSPAFDWLAGLLGEEDAAEPLRVPDVLRDHHRRSERHVRVAGGGRRAGSGCVQAGPGLRRARPAGLG